MRNITDQFFTLAVTADLLFRRFLQPDPHFLEVIAEIINLPDSSAGHTVVQITVADILGSRLKFPDRIHNSPVDPEANGNTGYRQDNQYHHNCLEDSAFQLRGRIRQHAYEKNTSKEHRNNNHREKRQSNSGPEIHIRSFFHTTG